MSEPPVEEVQGLTYITDGSLAYAGHHFHEPGHRVHTHSFVEIAVVTGGQGVHTSLSGRRDLQVGDVILLRPGVWHGYEDCRGLDLYNCCVNTGLLTRELAWTREDPFLGRLLWPGPDSLQRRGMLTTRLDPDALHACTGHLDALARLRHEPAGRHRGDIIGRLSMLLGQVARAADADADGHGTDRDRPAHPAVLAAVELLESRPAHDWTLAELASELHLTPRYLIRLFKAATGLPPMAYLAQHRVETAASLLLHTDLPVSQIAKDVGWADQNYFARRFKAHYGVTATTYRRLRSAAPRARRPG